MRRSKPIRRKSPQQRVKESVDALIKVQMLEKYGDRCLYCGSNKGISASHILPKGTYPRLRFELLNLIPLCVAHHLYLWHRSPLEAHEWFEKKFPGRYQQLQIMAATARRVDAKELLIALQSEAKGRSDG